MFKITRNDLKLFISDKRALMMTFLLPIALISLFTLAYGGMGKNNQSHPYNLLVADLDSTKESHRIIAQLDSEKSLTINQQSYPNAMELVKKGKEPAALVFHKGFSDSIAKGAHAPIELMIDEAREAEVGLLQQALFSKLFGIIGSAAIKNKVEKQIDSKYANLNKSLIDSIHKQIEENFSSLSSSSKNTEGQDGSIKITKLVAAKEDNTIGLVQAVAGTAVMMLLFSVAGMGASLLTEKEEGTLKKLLCSPIHPTHILLGKMISANIIAIFQLAVMVVYAWLVFGLNLFQNIPALILLIIATAFACSSFGMLLASIAKSRQQVQSYSTLIIMSMSAIGGSMIPSFIMPAWMQKISVLSVNYWSIQGFFDIFWRQLPLGDTAFLMRIVILFCIGGLMTFISLRLFTKNLLEMH